MQLNAGCDLGQFLDGCIALESFAKDAVAGTHNAFEGKSRAGVSAELLSGSVVSEDIQASHPSK